MGEIMHRRVFCQKLAETFELTRDCLKKPSNEQGEELANLFGDIVSTERYLTLIKLSLMPIRIAMVIKRSTTVDQNEILDHLDHHLDMWADSLRVVGYQPSAKIPEAIDMLQAVLQELNQGYYDHMPYIKRLGLYMTNNLLSILQMD